jgi:hypothetical protein
MIHNAYTTKLKGGFTTIGMRVALTTMLTVDLGADLSLGVFYLLFVFLVSYIFLSLFFFL